MWLFLVLGAIALGYWLSTRPYKYWIQKGVKQDKPVPLFGDTLGIMLKKESLSDMIIRLYNNVKNVRYLGIYQFMQPILLVKDPDLIKQITVKDFDHFTDRSTFIPEDADPLWGKNLVALTGKKWHEMRSTLTPVFTSSKMKFMFSLMVKNGQQFVDYFLRQNQKEITVEMKDAFTRFSNDVIANTAFGIECDSLKEPNNEFYSMGKEVTNFSGFFRNLKFFICSAFPNIFKILGLRFFSDKVSNFFINLISKNIQTRKKHKIVRPDLVHVLMEARKDNIKIDQSSLGFTSETGKKSLELSDLDITAQGLLFFFAGFDGVSNLMGFTAYELAINPDVQEKLTEEIDGLGNELTYEALLGMKYLDMVINECLRKWPNSVGTDRVCTKTYTIEAKDSSEQTLTLSKGDNIWIPIFGLHHDSKYWTNPERFDPERFNDINKQKINPYTYLPFGIGPRNCIGFRFALLETKILLYFMLKNFQIIVVNKTEIPLVLRKGQFPPTAENGFWLGLKRRQD